MPCSAIPGRWNILTETERHLIAPAVEMVTVAPYLRPAGPSGTTSEITEH